MWVNHVILTGKLSSDPTLDYTGKGTARAVFWVHSARTSRSLSGEDVVKKYQIGIRVMCWSQRAEYAHRFLRTGSHVLVIGRLVLEQADSGNYVIDAREVQGTDQNPEIGRRNQELIDKDELRRLRAIAASVLDCPVEDIAANMEALEGDHDFDEDEEPESPES